MKKETITQTPESIREYINHFQKSRILLSAFELDIFSVLDKAPKTSAEVAKKIKADTRATDRLMNAAVALGFLEKKNSKFQNTKETSAYMVKGKPGYMSGLMHTISLWQTWSTLTESVRKGKSVFQRPKTINNRDTFWLEAFIGAMHYRAAKQAQEIVAKVDMKGVKKVLDVGGGSGAFAMAFAKAGKDVNATVFDLPNVTPITLKYIYADKMITKVDTSSGDYNTDPLPKGYDIIFLSAVIHINSYKGNVALIKKCAASLNKGGRVIIQDHVMNEDRTTPPGGAIFALNMLVGTEEGDTYTEKEMREWFEKAGMKFEKRIETFMGNALVIGRKK
jgi:cyclopropane fatty-acyl-phospholipid synthase-like methyltransferase